MESRDKSMGFQFQDRRHAGKLLAELLAGYRGNVDGIVLALPRGGVVLGAEIARDLQLPLEVCVVRKLSVPGQPELAMGAIAPGVVWLDPDIVATTGVSQEEIEEELRVEQTELARRHLLYRQGREALPIEGKVVIVVDDGIATGSTVEAALQAIRQQRPKKIVLAAAVAAPSALARLRKHADEVVCVLQPVQLRSIGEWYRDFTQVSDEEVLNLLEGN